MLVEFNLTILVGYSLAQQVLVSMFSRTIVQVKYVVFLNSLVVVEIAKCIDFKGITIFGLMYSISNLDN